MDSEKNAHMRHLLLEGRPVTDEGPYYHHAWWESYKGGVKGKLGGGALGAGIGALTGMAAATAAVILAPVVVPGAVIGVTAAGLTVAGFAGAGMLYGVKEFSDTGKIVGGQAAIADAEEKRMKPYIDAKTNELKEEIGEIKAIIKGEPVPEKTAEAKTAALVAAQDDYRTEHFQGTTPETDKPIFWKVAMVGLAVGLIAGAVLAGGGYVGEVLHGLGLAGTESGLGVLGNYLAGMTAMGAIGASFGINRDIFRKAFDNTDMWFRGFVSHDHSKKVLLDSPALQQAYAEACEKKEESRQTVLYQGHIDYPESPTHHQDKYAAAKQVLKEMDHTKMVPH